MAGGLAGSFDCGCQSAFAARSGERCKTACRFERNITVLADGRDIAFAYIARYFCRIGFGCTAVVCCRFSLARAVIAPAINIVKATPVASFIMLALLWLDRNILPIFITVLIALPVVHSNVSGGIFAIDRGLLQVCRSFGFGFWKKIRILYIPSVFPYFLSACRSSLGLAWKAGVAAEVLAVPAVSIGKMIYGSKMYLETTDLFAWSAVVIVLSVIIENVICAALSRAGRRYERQGV